LDQRMQFDRVKRREFITLLGGAAAWPLAARAQQPGQLARIGFLTLATGPTPAIKGFQHGLQQLGYVEGQNLILIFRWAAGQTDRLAELADDLLRLNVDVIASNSTEAILAVRDRSKTIPLVMTSISDPIGNKLVASFARPGGNTTGVTLFSTELAGKRLELLREIVPRLARVGLLVQRDHPPPPRPSSPKHNQRHKPITWLYKSSRCVPMRSTKAFARSRKSLPMRS